MSSRESEPSEESSDGVEPDYRFTLANERTFLAWIRTALALLAGAIAVVQLLPQFGFVGARDAIGALLAVMGVGIAFGATRHWQVVQRAMRHSQPLPRTKMPVFLTVGILVLTLFIVLVILIPHRG